MRIQEFTERFLALDCRLLFEQCDFGKVMVILKDGLPIAHVFQHKLDEYYTDYDHFKELPQFIQDEITELLAVFARTPMAAR